MVELFPPLLDSLLIFFAAMLAGTLNAVAGGGTFFAFPALLMTGIPALAANATSSVAVWPGVIASSIGYRNQLSAYKKYLPLMGLIGILGGWGGGKLLLSTSEHDFEQMVPWLLLVATVLFTFGKPITRFTHRIFGNHAGSQPLRLAFAAVLMLAISIYGGFFGAGIGILMLAMLQVIGLNNLHEMNALKAVLGVTIHGAAIFALIFGDIIRWPEAIIMAVGAMIGGYYAARIALKLPEHYIRRFVIVMASSTTLYFFLV